MTQRKAARLVGIGVRHPGNAAPDATSPIGLLSIRCPNALLWSTELELCRASSKVATTGKMRETHLPARPPSRKGS